VTEADLIVRARAGDAGAWDSLTRLHQEPIFRFAYLLLGDADDAQDVTQETFVRAFFGLRRFDIERSLRPWLLRIVSRLSNNWRRSAARQLEALRRLAREPQPEQHATVPLEEAQQLWAAVRQLRLAHREVIYLRFFLELGEQETAAAAGVPIGTVKSRSHRALEELRLIIAREYPDLQEAMPI
jgi:RNA polymerase sigma-70 factor (ECF subfamily)